MILHLVGLYQLIESHSMELQKLLETRRTETAKRLSWLLELEDSEPFTLSNETLRESYASENQKG